MVRENPYTLKVGLYNSTLFILTIVQEVAKRR